MKIFRLFMMLMLGIMLNVNLTSCSKEDIVPDKEHPNGIPSDIPDNIIYYITSDKDIVRFQNEDVFGGAKIVSNTYSSTKGYGTIEFASEVTAIEPNAFYGKTPLTYIALPNSVKSIGNNAFQGCSGLASVTIPNSVTSIGWCAFAYCSGLTSVTIGNSVTSIREEAFCGCSGLTSIVVEKGNSVYDSRNNCNAIIETKSNTLHSGCKTTIIPNSVTSIGDDAFRECSGLTSVTIPYSVTSIGDFAFSGCSGLTSVTIPNSVTSIGWCAFSGCSGLTSVTIPNSVKSIGRAAFGYSSGLTSVTIGNSVESIGHDAFFGCSKLRDVYCHAKKVPSAYDYFFGSAFDDSSIAKATLHVPAASIGSYRATSPWSSFGNIVALDK